MSKRKVQSNRLRKKIQQEQQTKKRSKLLPSILAICTVLGSALSLVVFLPRPTVLPPSVPLDQADQFSVSFDITNSGYIPLEDCTAYLGVGQIVGKDARLDPCLFQHLQPDLLCLHGNTISLAWMKDLRLFFLTLYNLLGRQISQ